MLCAGGSISFFDFCQIPLLFLELRLYQEPVECTHWRSRVQMLLRATYPHPSRDSCSTHSTRRARIQYRDRPIRSPGNQCIPAGRANEQGSHLRVHSCIWRKRIYFKYPTDNSDFNCRVPLSEDQDEEHRRHRPDYRTAGTANRHSKTGTQPPNWRQDTIWDLTRKGGRLFFRNGPGKPNTTQDIRLAACKGPGHDPGIRLPTDTRVGLTLLKPILLLNENLVSTTPYPHEVRKAATTKKRQTAAKP